MSLVLDDRNPAVQYSEGWGEAGVQEEFQGTTSWTETVGATARVTFTGRGISVVGTITILGVKESPVSSYIIDNDPSTRFRFVGAQVDRIQRLTPFYKIDNLEYGEHVLTITNESSEGTLYLDFFEVSGFENPGGSSSSSPSSTESSSPNPLPSNQSLEPGQSSNSPSPSAPSPSIPPISRSSLGPDRSQSSSSGLALPTSDLSGDNAQQSNSDGGPPVGAIAGGVVGGIAVICIAILVFILCKRRERRRRDRELLDNYSGPQMQPAIQPFMTSPHLGTNTGHYAPSGYGASVAPVGSGSSHQTGMMSNPYPNYHPQNASSYQMPVAAGYTHADDYNASMRDTASPLPVSSASIVSGRTGASSGQLGAGDVHRPLVVHSGSTGSHKLTSNMALTAPNRAPEADAPPGYQN